MQSATLKLDGERLCYLTTTGRITGASHEIEIWYAQGNGQRIYMLSGGRDRSDWIKNLRANPRVRVRIAGETYEGSATIIEHEDEDPLARRLLAAKYQSWREGQPLSDWARTSLPVAIDLDLP